MRRNWDSFNQDELEEILACMIDSDRYILEPLKIKIVDELEREITIKKNRGRDLES